MRKNKPKCILKIYKCRILRTLSRFQQKFTSLHLQVEKVLSVGPPYSVVVPTMYQSSLRGVGLNPAVIGDPKKIFFKKFFFQIFFRKIYKCRTLKPVDPLTRWPVDPFTLLPFCPFTLLPFFQKIYKCRILRTLSRFQQKFFFRKIYKCRTLKPFDPLTRWPVDPFALLPFYPFTLLPLYPFFKKFTSVGFWGHLVVFSKSFFFRKIYKCRTL